MLSHTCGPGIGSVECYRLALLPLPVLFELSSLGTLIGVLLWLFHKGCTCTLYSLLSPYNRLLHGQVLRRIHNEGCSGTYELHDRTESIESTVRFDSRLRTAHSRGVGSPK